MNEISLSLRQTVVVGVSLDASSRSLVEAADAVAARLGKKLLLVHAIEPAGEAATVAGIAPTLEYEARVRAEAALEDLVKGAYRAESVDWRIAAGKPRAAVVREAIERNACLIVVGTTPAGEGKAGRGISTALSLLGTSPVPVLALDPRTSAAFAGDRVQILLCDDLGPMTRSAARFALELATAIGNADILHLHVCGLSLETLEVALNSASAAARTSLGPGASASDVLATLRAKLKLRLQDRVLPQIPDLEAAGGSYAARIEEGDPRDRIAAEAEASGATLVVLGRHQTLHTAPFHLGRMPFRAMFALGVPLLVVPELA